VSLAKSEGAATEVMTVSSNCSSDDEVDCAVFHNVWDYGVQHSSEDDPAQLSKEQLLSFQELLGSKQRYGLVVKKYLGMGGQSSTWLVDKAPEESTQLAADGLQGAGAAGGKHSTGSRRSSSWLEKGKKCVLKAAHCPRQLQHADWVREGQLQTVDELAKLLSLDTTQGSGCFEAGAVAGVGAERFTPDDRLCQHLKGALVAAMEEFDMLLTASDGRRCPHVLQALHLGLIRIPSISKICGIPAMLLEYAAGGSLDQVLQVYATDDGMRGLPSAGALHITRGTLSALVWTHQNEVVHGDIKTSEQHSRYRPCIVLYVD
jgi:serine/threonine protein kinase